MSWKRCVRRCARLSILFAVVVGCQRAAPTVVTPSPPWTVLTPVVELTATEDEKSSSQLAIVQLKNISQSPASIAGIQTGCGCATVESVPQTPIAAGAVAEIKIRVRLPDYGEQVLRVRIETSPPSTVPLEAELKLHGKVWPVPRLIYPIDDVRLTPPFKTTATKTFTILTWEKKGSTPWLRGFRADPPRCRLELPDPPTEREFTNESVERRYLVRVEGESVGLEDSLQVISVIPEFDPPMADTRPFRVLIESRSQIRAIPSVINVSVKSLPLKRQILITSEAADWTCTPTQNWPAWLRLVELVDVSSPSQKTYRCTVELLSDARSQHSTAVLSFHIRDGDVEAVTIPVHIVEN